MDEDFIWMIFCLVTAFVVSGYLHIGGKKEMQKKSEKS